MFKPNYSFHCHTYRCGHAKGDVEDYVKLAIEIMTFINQNKLGIEFVDPKKEFEQYKKRIIQLETI